MTKSECIYRLFAKHYNYEYYVNDSGADLRFWRKGTFTGNKPKFENYNATGLTLEEAFINAFGMLGYL